MLVACTFKPLYYKMTSFEEMEKLPPTHSSMGRVPVLLRVGAMMTLFDRLVLTVIGHNILSLCVILFILASGTLSSFVHQVILVVFKSVTTQRQNFPFAQD